MARATTFETPSRRSYFFFFFFFFGSLRTIKRKKFERDDLEPRRPTDRPIGPTRSICRLVVGIHRRAKKKEKNERKKRKKKKERNVKELDREETVIGRSAHRFCQERSTDVANVTRPTLQNPWRIGRVVCVARRVTSQSPTFETSYDPTPPPLLILTYCHTRRHTMYVLVVDVLDFKSRRRRRRTSAGPGPESSRQNWRKLAVITPMWKSSSKETTRSRGSRVASYSHMDAARLDAIVHLMLSLPCYRLPTIHDHRLKTTTIHRP